jgi:universal stress protein F
MILVALDGSPRGPAVLAKGVAMAKAQGERLILFRSVGVPTDLPQDIWRSSDRPLSDVLNERAQVYLHECETMVPDQVRGGTKVVIGSPWQAICETARILPADLIVIGSHGYSNIDRFLGTTAARVVNHAPCSVLVVRPDGGYGRPE